MRPPRRRAAQRRTARARTGPRAEVRRPEPLRGMAAPAKQRVDRRAIGFSAQFVHWVLARAGFSPGARWCFLTTRKLKCSAPARGRAGQLPRRPRLVVADALVRRLPAGRRSGCARRRERRAVDAVPAAPPVGGKARAIFWPTGRRSLHPFRCARSFWGPGTAWFTHWSVSHNKWTTGRERTAAAKHPVPSPPRAKIVAAGRLLRWPTIPAEQ